MPRLKSRNKWPPHGFQIMLAEIGMKTAITGSFEEVVAAFSKIVKQNPALAQKFGWPTHPAGQADFVDEREAARMISHGWTDFVEFGTPLVYAPAPATDEKKNWRGVAAAVISGGKAAYTAYRDMFGPHGPVARDVAERRAAVCHSCPQNDTVGGVASYFVDSTAKGIMALLGALKDLQVTVAEPDKAGICKACKCPLRAKLFVQIAVISEQMPKPLWPQLQQANPKCWILSEAGK